MGSLYLSCGHHRCFTMGYLFFLGVLSATLTYANDVVCPTGKSNKQVAVGAGDNIVYRTQDGDTYSPKTSCVTKFTLKKSCKKVKFSCDYFQLGKGSKARISRSRSFQQNPCWSLSNPTRKRRDQEQSARWNASNQEL